ncbi:hypothetical protein JHK87_055040 [Glycine soja]|nr:hypothetical protein JHK87_055040 [Glycine soja]
MIDINEMFGVKIADVGDNQVPDNPNYRHFLDQQQQFDLHDDKLYVGQRFRQLEDLKHAVKMWHIKNHVTFKSKRCAKNTWVLCCPAEGCQWKLRASERKNLKVREIRMIEEPHTCVMPTISQDHNKMDSKLVCNVVEGQRYSKRLNDRKINALLKVTCQRLVEREHDIMESPDPATQSWVGYGAQAPYAKVTSAT